MKKAIILFGCASHRQGPRAISQALALGLEAILVDTHDNINRSSRNVLHSIPTFIIKSKKFDDCLPLIKSLCSTYKVIGIYTFEEYSVETCSRLCEELGYVSNSIDAITRIRNKHLCRDILSKNGLLQPRSYIFENISQAEKFLHENDIADWIIKPVNASGSQGVSLIFRSSIQELHIAFTRLTPPQQHNFIIEQFIDGNEFSLEGYFYYGKPVFLGITEKSLKPGTAFVEDMHVFPAKISTEMRTKIYNIAEKALELVGLTFGNFHLEFWLTAKGIIIGEIHGRPGGDYIHLLTEVSTGIPTYSVVFQQYLNPHCSNPIPPDIFYQCGAAVKYFNSSEGQLISINKPIDLNKNPHVILTEITVTPGDTIYQCSDSSKRVGCIVIKERNAEKAKLSAQELAENVKFNTI